MIPKMLWTYRARLDRVIDGDTVALVVDLGFGVAKSSGDNHFRVLGVNCPEMHGTSEVDGWVAKEFTERWFRAAPNEDWPFIIQTEKSKNGEVQTFSRWVANIWRCSDGANLAVDLLATGNAVPMNR